MGKRYKVAFATGSRADYGIVRNYLDKLNSDERVELTILATGALIDERYGNAISIIENDGFAIECRVDLELDSSSNASVIQSMAIALREFGNFFGAHKYDLLIILGDRYEMLSVATAAAMQKIPILHLHGGEATFANYDEFIRHAITKMSKYHFTATEEYRKRVIQLGENPDTVFNLGALGAENCLHINMNNVSERVKELATTECFCVLFHPETLTDEPTENQVLELLNALERFVDRYTFVIIGSNADTSSDVIRNKMKKFDAKYDNVYCFENLHPDEYHYLVKNSKALIGNSSSGIIEAPSLNAFTINIGHRQDGRVRGDSVLDVPCRAKEIASAIHKVLLEKEEKTFTNPYSKKNSAELYYRQTMLLLEGAESDNRPKVFYDLL